MPRNWTPSPRVAGERLAPSERLAYATAIRAELARNPTATVDQLRQVSGGAPDKVVIEVRRRWRAEVTRG